jgi:hypothetical protein
MAMLVLRRVLSAAAVPVFLLAATLPVHADPPTVLYRLSGSSGFLSGCIEGQCLCPVSLAFMGGTFGLTLGPAQRPETYDISDIDWFTHWNGEVQDVITGVGTYVLDGESHRIVLELKVNGSSPILLDSGLVVRGSEFPAIVISALTDTICFQEGVSIDAAPSAYSLDVAMASTTDLTWTVVPDASSYDVVQGDLALLRASAGAYDYSSTACLASQVQTTSAVHDTPLMPGEAVWFLVRGLPGPGYDSGGPGQVVSRDEEINQSANGCP